MVNNGDLELRSVRAWVDGRLRHVTITVRGGVIADIHTPTPAERRQPSLPDDEAHRYWLLPGVVDAHVHFREPGLTQKADITSESRAAAAGGVTTVLDMPNVVPTTTTPEALAQKHRLFDEKCVVRYGLFYGITATNIDEALALPQDQIVGYKVFLGSSTGGMLMNDSAKLRHLLGHTERVVAIHSESEDIIRANRERLLHEMATAGGRSTTSADSHMAPRERRATDDLPIWCHPQVRSAAACLATTREAVRLAIETGGQLHVCHVTTADELRFIAAQHAANVTAEACVAHLWFTDRDYERCGSRIKCNPAIKTVADRTALRRALRPGGGIDTVATDHAPHLLADKQGGALRAASGMPSVQFSLVVMLELVRRGVCSLADVVRLMCTSPARRFGLNDRGDVRVGALADLVLVNTAASTAVTPDAILSKCGWSPFEGEIFSHRVERTWVGGREVWSC